MPFKLVHPTQDNIINHSVWWTSWITELIFILSNVSQSFNKALHMKSYFCLYSWNMCIAYLVWGRLSVTSRIKCKIFDYIEWLSCRVSAMLELSSFSVVVWNYFYDTFIHLIDIIQLLRFIKNNFPMKMGFRCYYKMLVKNWIL